MDSVQTTHEGDEMYQRFFAFDNIHGPEARQAEVYQTHAEGVTRNAMDGFNGTILAFGQTGSGKTHTMMGSVAVPEEFGIVPRAIRTIFEEKEAASDEFNVEISYVEIYNENVYDLLGPNATKDLSQKVPLPVRESKQKNFYVQNLTR